MASNSFAVLSKATKRPLTKLLFLKDQETLRNFTVICSRKPKKKSNLSGRRCFSDDHPNIVKGNYPECKIPDMPFHEFIAENMGRWENRIAVECGATDRKITYKEMFQHARSLAASLQRKFQIQKGDIQATVLPNCPEYPVIYLAGSMTGAVTTTINPIYTPTEISHQLQITKPKIIYTVPDVYKKCVEALNLIQLKAPIVVVKNYPDAVIPSEAVAFTELSSTNEKFTPVDFHLDDDFVLPFSSGTSGLPKGVQLSHKNITVNVTQCGMGNKLKENPERETDQCPILAVLPMFHIYGMTVVTFDGLREGAKIISIPKFEPKLFIDTIYNKETELMYLVPPLIFFLSTSSMVEPKMLKKIRNIVVGAAPLGPKDLDKFLAKAEHIQISQGYGMTETSPLITLSFIGRYHKVSSAGHPAASTLIKVADLRNGWPLDVGKRGEICVKGPQVMKGYFNQPEETKKTFDEDGWLKTGDIGYYDEEKDFYIVDRMKELIKVKGYQVAPAELEEFLRNHPKILDAGVIGVKHPDLGQAPKAIVVKKKGVTLDEEEVKEYIKNRLSNYKSLAGGVEFVEEIPKSSAGKILRKELRKMYGDD